MTQKSSKVACEELSARAYSDGDGADDDVVLRLPKKQMPEVEKLIRSHAEQPAESTSHCDSSRRGSSVLVEELPTQAKPLTNTTETEEICCHENWTSYILYREENKDGGSFVDSSPDQFDRDSTYVETKALTLTRFKDNKIELTISSPYLREHLLRLINIEFYHGVTVGASKIILESPFTPLYHHLGDMRAAIIGDKNATKSQRNDMEVLHFFVTEGFLAKKYADVRSKISQGFIEYNELWALFKPGDFAVSSDPIGDNDISQVLSMKLEKNRLPHGPQYFWFITLVKIAWSEGRFRRVSYRTQIDSFTGFRKISDLQICPLWHREDRDLLRDTAIQRGKSWKKYWGNEPVTMTYEGQAVICLVASSFLRDLAQFNTFNVRAA
jgi:hypothetical protein